MGNGETWMRTFVPVIDNKNSLDLYIMKLYLDHVEFEYPFQNRGDGNLLVSVFHHDNQNNYNSNNNNQQQ